MKFKQELAKSYSRVPERLRCGVAQGQVCSLGNGFDYVGPCINIAARLQKLANLGMCVSKRGINLQLCPSEKLASELITKTTQIRGVGEELIYVLKEEYDSLSQEEQSLIIDP